MIPKTANEAAPLLDEKEKDSQGLDSEIALHTEILSDTKQGVSNFIGIIIFTSFAYASRVNIEILYALTFSNSLIEITIFIYAGSLCFALISLFGGHIANLFGFDKVASVQLILMFIGVVLESFAWNVYIWGLGYIISRQAVTALCLGYIAHMLPPGDSRNYTTYYYQVYVISYLAGPAISGMSKKVYMQ